MNDKIENSLWNEFARLKISANDPCRKYLSTIIEYLNSYDFDKLSLYLDDICAADFQAVLKRDVPLQCISGGSTKKMVMEGVPSFIKFVSELSLCVPDRIYSIKETILRNQPDFTLIMCHLTVTATLVLKMNTNNLNVHCNLDDKTMTLHKSVNFNPKLELVGGEGSPVRSMKCTATLKLNRERKVSHLLFDYTQDRDKHWVDIPNKI